MTRLTSSPRSRTGRPETSEGDQGPRGTCADIVASGGQAAAYRASVEEPAQVRAMTEQVLSDFGGVDIVVCNAGIARRGLLLADTEPAELERVVRTHVFGAYDLCLLR